MAPRWVARGRSARCPGASHVSDQAKTQELVGLWTRSLRMWSLADELRPSQQSNSRRPSRNSEGHRPHCAHSGHLRQSRNDARGPSAGAARTAPVLLPRLRGMWATLSGSRRVAASAVALVRVRVSLRWTSPSGIARVASQGAWTLEKRRGVAVEGTLGRGRLRVALVGIHDAASQAAQQSDGSAYTRKPSSLRR